MQWKKMGWPIMVDQVNQLGMEAVPVTIGIDEHGIVRTDRLRLDAADSLETDFVDCTFDAPEPPLPATPLDASAPDLDNLESTARASGGDARAWKRCGDGLLLWAGSDRLDDAITAYRQAAELAPSDGAIRFALGVAYRQRYDSPGRRPDDFRGAVRSWKEALDLDPNQYIWRRRIQQYGPRLDKPYPFYDWVHVARDEIKVRGEEPHSLMVEPRGAEFADPQREFEVVIDGSAGEPDAEDRIERDDGRLIAVEAAAVPPVIAPGEAARVHVSFRPADTSVHWNNEAEDLELWVRGAQAWQVDRRSVSIPGEATAESTEERVLEVEVHAPQDATDGVVEVDAYALYYVCEDAGGTCLYRRQDIRVPVTVRREDP